MSELLIDHLSNRIDLDATDKKIITEYTFNKSFKKGEAITKQNNVEQNLYFILSGVVRLFFEREDRDITFNFGFPNHFISAFSSYLTKEPSLFYLEALTEVNAICIPKENLEYIYQNTGCGLHLARVFLEETIIYMSQRETDFMLLSPTERYLSLFERTPTLLQDIPLKYLASYIGITPQALSRIRSKIN